MVVWVSRDQGDDEWAGVYGQRFHADGSTAGDEFHVNTYTTQNQGDYSGLSVTGLTNGGFLVTWQSDEQDGSGLGIFGQLYDDEGNKNGDEFQVNTITIGYQYLESGVALSNGGFMVSWTMEENGSHDIYSRIFDSEGHAVGTPTLQDFATLGSHDIENAIGGSGDDEITGNQYDNVLSGGLGADTLTGGAGNDTLEGGDGYDTYANFTAVVGTSVISDFGHDVINDTAGSGLIDLSNHYSLSDIDTWTAVDGSDDDSFVDQLLITFNSGATLTILNYFDNSSVEDDASNAGSGYLDISTNGDSHVDFAQVQSLIESA